MAETITPPRARQTEPLNVPEFRRVEDHELRLLLADVPEAGIPGGLVLPFQQGVALRAYRLEGSDEVRPVPLSEGFVDTDDAVFLMDAGGEDAILLVGATARRLPRRGGGEELLARATSGAVAWKREQLRALKQVRRADQLIAFADRLSLAKTAPEVIQALMEYVTRIIGGYTTLVLGREREEDCLWPAVDNPVLRSDVWNLRLPYRPRFLRSGLITSEDASPDTGAPFPGISPLFTEDHVVAIAHHPLDENRVVCLLERRRSRVFEPEDWDLFRTLTRLAAGALERIRLLDEVHQLSLTDPLTGLANRRHLRVMLEHSLASARRGEPLTLVMLDLDGFKAVNDQFGHLRGDRILRMVAEKLREQARGSDLVVRYGGDEFIVVVHGDAMGAQTLLHRVKEQLEGQVSFTAGVAEYHPSIQTVDQLIEIADRQLYRLRESRSELDRRSRPGTSEEGPRGLGRNVRSSY